MAITGAPEGEPTKVGVAASDLFADFFAAVGIASALTGRERTGSGTHVETDLFSATLACLINVAQSALLTGDEGQRHGSGHPQIVPYRVFAAADADFALAVGTDPQFERLAALLARPQWARDPLYRTNQARVVNRARLEAELEKAFRRGPRRSASRGTRRVWTSRGSSTPTERTCVENSGCRPLRRRVRREA